MDVNKWLDELLNVKKIKVYEDVIDESSGYNQLGSLLAGSDETISKLKDYAKSNHERSEPYDKSLLVDSENFYIAEDKAYYFTDKQWGEIQSIVNDCKNLAILNKTLGKSPNISYKFTDIYKKVYAEIKSMKETVYSDILRSFPENEITLIMRKVLNNLLIEQFKQPEVSEFLFPYKKVCILLGIELSNLYITNNLMYERESSGYEADVTRKGDKVIRPKYKMEADEYKEIMKTIITKIEENTISITDYMSLNIDIKHDKEFDYLNAAILITWLANKETVEKRLNVEDYNRKVKAQELTADMAYRLGELITKALLEKKLFISEQDENQVPHLKLGSENLQIEITASSVFTKPMLSTEEISTKATHKVLDNMTFTLKTKASLIRTESNVKLYPKSTLEELMHHKTQYKIALNNYREFVRYIEEILDLPFDKDNASIQSSYGYIR
jgi:hypothetical protein